MGENKPLWIAHPTGNQFVRALLAWVEKEKRDYRFFTTLGFSHERLAKLPGVVRQRLKRRSYDIPAARMSAFAGKEIARLLFRPHAPRAVDAIYRALDQEITKALRTTSTTPGAVYLYEDGAADTFEYLQDSGVRRIYELPIAWHTVSRSLLNEEAVRYPDWAETLGAPNDPPEKLARKNRELALADRIIVPSKFVFDTLPAEVRSQKEILISPFGTPPLPAVQARAKGPLRILFAGTMSQRKGLADLFEAMKLLRTKTCELVVLGAALKQMEFYTSRCSFTYCAPRAFSEVLELMSTCDLLVLPSIVEGRALVQQEAMACGLPLVVTRNAGGEDLVIEHETGFLVPIRSPESLALRIEWFLNNRAELPRMSESCRTKALEYTWADYAARNLAGLPGPTQTS